jgi:diguanylate cyclase (GGDEF)-like protein
MTKGKGPRHLSLFHYSLIYLAGLALALALGGWYVLKELEEAALRTEAAGWMAARSELREGVKALLEYSDKNVKELASRDETRRQLSAPQFPHTRRDGRVKNPGATGEGARTLVLYEPQGRVLATADKQEAIPAVPPEGVPRMLVREAGRDHFYDFAPVYADSGRTMLLGHVGLRLNIIEEISRARPMRYVDTSTIELALPPSKSAVLDGDPEKAVLAMLNHLSYRAKPNPEASLYQEIFSRAVAHILMVIAVALFLGFAAVQLFVTRPLARFTRHIDRLGVDKTASAPVGALDRPLPVLELETVRRSFLNYRRRVRELHDDLAEASREFWNLAHHDPLTGTYNRRAYERDWRSLLDESKNKRIALTLMLFDCDHFKAINDTYGHQVGDKVIRAIAERLQDALRSDDRLYRLGGDEFATVLKDANLEQARQIAERCQTLLTGYDFRALGVREPVTVSIGLAQASSADPETLSELPKRADLAMYKAKRPNSTKIVIFHEEAHDCARTIVANREVSAVYQAIADPARIEMHYQPVVRLPDARAEYYEALVRIRHEGELIHPGAVLPVVEARRMEMEFDRAVLTAVLRDLEQGLLPAGSGVAVNLSGSSIIDASMPPLIRQLSRYLKDFKVVLEITENALITPLAQASNHLEELRRAGFKVALDDFGSGYSSVRYLASMPVDLVKFDITMIQALQEEGREGLIVTDLARMIRDAGYELVAEGIESLDAAEKVKALGFSHAQGHYFGHPQRLAPQRPQGSASRLTGRTYIAAEGS